MSAMGDSTEKLKGVHISSLDEDDEVEEVVEEEDEEGDDSEEEGDDSEEEGEPVTLGFLEKTKNHWSLSRQVFPSKAGGVPVLIFNSSKLLFFLCFYFNHPPFSLYKASPVFSI